jgi:type II secretory pathway component GspD/PulD (secretin)
MSGGDGPRRQVTTANRQNEPQAGATSQTDPALEKKRFTLTLENTDQYEALKQLFQQAGVSYVLESETRGPKVTINLKNQPFSVALKTLLNASEQPLAYRVENGVYRVAPLRQRRPGIGRRSAEVSDSSPVILVETARPGASPTASEPGGEVRTSVILPQIAKPPLPPAVPPPTMDGER